MAVYIGIDNGVSGTIGIVDELNNPHIFKVPVRSCLNYQKAKVKHITRIDTEALEAGLRLFIEKVGQTTIPPELLPCRCLVERPMVNPQRFEATVSALRALEATIIVLEKLNIPYEYTDSKAWQKVLLPKCNDWKMLKQVSKEVAERAYPNIDWSKFPDADGLHIARFCQMYYSQKAEPEVPKVEPEKSTLF